MSVGRSSNKKLSKAHEKITKLSQALFRFLHLANMAWHVGETFLRADRADCDDFLMERDAGVTQSRGLYSTLRVQRIRFD
jgi:hypothetical protein